MRAVEGYGERATCIDPAGAAMVPPPATEPPPPPPPPSGAARTPCGPWTVDLFAHGLAGRRCHLRLCPQPYAGPYGSRETAAREAIEHHHRHHQEVDAPACTCPHTLVTVRDKPVMSPGLDPFRPAHGSSDHPTPG